MTYLRALLLILSIILAIIQINHGLLGFDLDRFRDLAEWARIYSGNLLGGLQELTQPAMT